LQKSKRVVSLIYQKRNTMITKGTPQYTAAQKVANELQAYAATNRWNQNSRFDAAYEAVGRLVHEVKKVGGFAAQVCESIDKTMSPFGKQVAFVSSKQAWIIACAAVENNIEFNF
jgi:hypothetical protein